MFRSLIPPTEDENNCIYYDQFKGIQNSPMQSKNLPDCFTGKCHRCLSGIVYLFVLLIYFNSSYSVTKGYECVNKKIPAFGKLQHEPLLITLIELSKPERRMFWSRSVFIHVCSCCFNHKVQAYFWFSLVLYNAVSLPALLCMIAIYSLSSGSWHSSLANVMLNDFYQMVTRNLLETSNTYRILCFSSLLQENIK